MSKQTTRKEIYGAMPQSAASQESPRDSSTTRQDFMGRVRRMWKAAGRTHLAWKELCPDIDRRT